MNWRLGCENAGNAVRVLASKQWKTACKAVVQAKVVHQAMQILPLRRLGACDQGRLGSNRSVKVREPAITGRDRARERGKAAFTRKRACNRHAEMFAQSRKELAHAIADNAVLVAIIKRVMDIDIGDVYRERLPKAIVRVTHEHGSDHAGLRVLFHFGNTRYRGRSGKAGLGPFGEATAQTDADTALQTDLEETRHVMTRVYLALKTQNAKGQAQDLRDLIANEFALVKMTGVWVDGDKVYTDDGSPW
eukprot:970244-Amphidinium_carterae.1